MMFRRCVLLGLLAVSSSLLADGKSDISVMTQNQYLGASLVPIISAISDPSQNPDIQKQAIISTLERIRDNRTSERITALADTIAERQPHFVGLQEVENIQCSPSDACLPFGDVFNDHLQLTLDALANAGKPYRALATVENLSIAGFPVFLDDINGPDIFISITDRDVILVRDDIEDAQATNLDCSYSSADGCNYSENIIIGGRPVLRGFVGVDATIEGKQYRIVNTHLEVPFALTDNNELVQSVQTEELLDALSTTDDDREIIVVGDFNSSPEDANDSSPYRQMTMNGFTDTWKKRPVKPSGFTCCQDSDLANLESALDTRIDHVFTSSEPLRVKANVLDNKPIDKTFSNLWPSDHSSVSVRFQYRNTRCRGRSGHTRAPGNRNGHTQKDENYLEPITWKCRRVLDRYPSRSRYCGGCANAR